MLGDPDAAHAAFTERPHEHDGVRDAVARGDPLAEAILAGGYANGSVIRVSVAGDTFEFSRG